MNKVREEVSADIKEKIQRKYLQNHFQYVEDITWPGSGLRVSNRFNGGEFHKGSRIEPSNKIIVREKEDYHTLKAFGEKFNYDTLVRDWDDATLEEIVPLSNEFDTVTPILSSSRAKKACEILSINEIVDKDGT